MTYRNSLVLGGGNVFENDVIDSIRNALHNARVGIVYLLKYMPRVEAFSHRLAV